MAKTNKILRFLKKQCYEMRSNLGKKAKVFCFDVKYETYRSKGG